MVLVFYLVNMIDWLLKLNNMRVNYCSILPTWLTVHALLEANMYYKTCVKMIASFMSHVISPIRAMLLNIVVQNSKHDWLTGKGAHIYGVNFVNVIDCSHLWSIISNIQ